MTPQEKYLLLSLLNQYENRLAFEKYQLGKTSVCKHAIDTGNNPPLNLKPYRIPFAKRKEIEDLVNETLEQNVIRPSFSAYSSPAVLVTKKDGTTRFCVDFKKLNSQKVRDVHPLPKIEGALNALHGAKYFSIIDENLGFWQIEIVERDKEKTEFITTNTLYEFDVMPFGFFNAPARFQSLMDKVLTGVKWKFYMPYIDNVLVFSKSFDDHLKYLQILFNRFREANLTMKPSNCMFAVTVIKYLGHTISSRGIFPDAEKIKAVEMFQRARNFDTVRQFLRLASYYRKFVENFAKKVKPLTHLTKMNVRFVWESEQENSFKMLKEPLVNAPILTHYNPECELKVRCDASGEGLGAILKKHEKKDAKVVQYASRLLNVHEKNYPISEIEALPLFSL